MGIALVAGMFFLWSSVFAIGKVALAYSPPIFLTGFRMLLAGALILGYLAIAKRGSFKLSIRHYLSLGLLAVTSIYLTNILEYWSLQYLTAAKSSFIYSLSPFFAALFSYLHFKEKMNLKKWVGMVIGFLGFLLPLFLTKSSGEEILHAFSVFSLPELAMTGAALCSVYGWVLLRIAVKGQTISPLMANGTSMFIGGALALFHSFFVDSWNPIPLQMDKVQPFLIATLSVTLISNIICYNLYGMMLRRYTATFLSFVGLLSPIFASLHGYIFLGEVPGWEIPLSTGVICLGLWLVYQAELKQGYIEKRAKKAEITNGKAELS